MQSLSVPFWAWIVLAVVVVASLAIDLIDHRGDHAASRKRAAIWSVVWITLALAFAGWVSLQFGSGHGTDFVTAWLLEKSLSVDNLFVFLVVFTQLKIPEADQHRVLFWGIVGAVVTRGIFIAGGSALLSMWHTIVYPLGAFLVYTAVKVAREHPTSPSKEGESTIMRLARKHVSYTPRFDEHRFFTLENGKRVATPLALALFVIEMTDVVFAVDSIPAVFAVTNEPFIVYSSNIFAILGLRALYLLLAGALAGLKYLHFGLAGILAFAGVKMLTSGITEMPHWLSLLVIGTVLTASIVPSVVVRRRQRARVPSHA
jgi:tellurite resistance protein TerC